MTGGELGFLLLGSHLGDPERRPLSPVQLGRLWERVAMQSQHSEGEVSLSYLRSLGYSQSDSLHLLRLLSQEKEAEAYVESARRQGFGCITRRSQNYPQILASTLGHRAPSVLWYKGDPGILNTTCISLVGSRDAARENLDFARAVGAEAAQQGLTLVSGGARGTDKVGQRACLDGGGNVICVIPDGFRDHHHPRKSLLYLSEDSFDLPFSARRALSRNHIIHILGEAVFVAQCGLHGGTWDGTCTNLKSGWRPVYAYEKGVPDVLLHMGANSVGMEQLEDLRGLFDRQEALF